MLLSRPYIFDIVVEEPSSSKESAYASPQPRGAGEQLGGFGNFARIELILESVTCLTCLTSLASLTVLCDAILDFASSQKIRSMLFYTVAREREEHYRHSTAIDKCERLLTVWGHYFTGRQS